MNFLDTTSKSFLTKKYLLHQRLKNSEFIAKTDDLFDFSYAGGVYIIRPCGMIFCSGKDIRIVSSAEDFEEALRYYTNLVVSYSKHNNKALRDVKVIIS